MEHHRGIKSKGKVIRKTSPRRSKKTPPGCWSQAAFRMSNRKRGQGLQLRQGGRPFLRRLQAQLPQGLFQEVAGPGKFL